MNQTVDELNYLPLGETDKRLLTKRTELTEAVATSNERFRTFMSNAPIILFALDHAGIFTLAEGRGLQVLGLEPGELVSLSAFEVYRDFPQTLDHIRRALAGETLTTIDRISDLIFEMQFTPLLDTEGQQAGVIGVATDIRERVQAEEAVRLKERQYRALIEQATDLVLILDPIGMCRYASPSHQRILGYSPEVLIGTNIFTLIHPADLSQALMTFTGAFQTSETTVTIECRMRHANGSWLTLECVGNNCLEDPAIEGLIINARDVTERTIMEETLRHQALHDALTELPNRTQLQEKLKQAILAAERVGSEITLLMMDIDRFKDVNDTFGHHHGDVLLQQVGARLRQCIDTTNTVARLGGDEFAVLLPMAAEESARRAVAELRKALEEPFTVADHPLQVEVSIGIARYPAHGSDPLTLLRRADVAMYTAKQVHEGYAFYDASHDQDSHRRLALVGALRHAIPANELRMYYQPKVELKSAAVHSAEALVRWQSPEYGFIPPDQFIPLAEQTGLIAPLTRWVLKTVVRQCRDWLDAGLDLCGAVNLSAWDLRDVTLPETVSALLEQYAVPPRLLRAELTESAVMTDADRALDVLTRLSTLGVRISVDDFGTGYSSLAYLKRLPIDELKIDRSFVQHMVNIEADTTIVRSTVSMAHNLGLRVVAEGVEDQATWELLAALECDTAQGYYMSRPVPAQELERWLRDRKA